MYTLDPNAPEPIMLLDEMIGADSDFPNDPYIDGSLFAKELLMLDSMGKKVINIWIASGGGSVIDGMKIYNAILQTKAKVNTHIIFAGSISAVISQAGRERTMADFGKLMFHNPSGGDEKGLNAIKDSIITMVEKRSKMSYSDISKMMNRTTWIGSDEALMLGLCDTIESSDSLNKPKLFGGDVAEMVNVAKMYVNNALKPIKNNMNAEVTKALGLSEDATTEEVVKAIAELKSTEVETETTTEVETETAPASESETITITTDNDTISALNEMVNTLKAELEAIKNSTKVAEENATKTKAIELVNKYTNKLGNVTEEVKTSWVNKAIANYNETETMLEALPLNFKAPSVENVTNKATEVEVPTTALYLSAKLKNELKKQGRKIYLA
jgi:ATP-dependent protease ClpP protease subunit